VLTGVVAVVPTGVVVVSPDEVDVAGDVVVVVVVALSEHAVNTSTAATTDVAAPSFWVLRMRQGYKAVPGPALTAW